MLAAQAVPTQVQPTMNAAIRGEYLILVRNTALGQSKLTISTQFEPLPVGYLPIGFSAPLDGSMAYVERVSDFSPETTMKRPVGSMRKPRGCFSVGVLPR